PAPLPLAPVLEHPAKITAFCNELHRHLSRDPAKARHMVGQVIEKIDMEPVYGDPNVRLRAHLHGRVSGVLELAQAGRKVANGSTVNRGNGGPPQEKSPEEPGLFSFACVPAFTSRVRSAS
ncbi:MAG: hypothetical protein AB1515_06190, partial [Nitrospirota bacterium]